jgi:integrase
MVSVVEGRTVYDVTDGLKAEQTKEEYRRIFRAFLRYRNVNSSSQPPPHLLLSLLQLDPLRIEEIIADYLLSLKQRGLRQSSLRSAKAAITHFFVINRVQLNHKWISSFVPPEEAHRDDRAYTDEEVRKLLAACSDERWKVVVLLLSATGMRKGAIPELRIGDITKINLSGIETYKIWVYNRSAKDRYYCFAIPELAKAINSYLDYRKRFGEVLSPEAPLIREQFDTYDPRTAKRPRSLSVTSFDKAMRRLVSKAGLDYTKGQCQIYNAFRKRVITIMIKAKVDYDTREYLVAHKHSRGLNVNYDRSTEEDRFLEWSKAIDLLTIDQTQRLEKENQDLKYTTAEEIAKLKTELREHKEFASKTAAEINDMKTRKDAYGRDSIYFVEPHLSNLTDYVNKIGAKFGLEPLKENKALKAEEKRNEIRRLKMRMRIENPHPDYNVARAARIEELENELKDLG